MISYDFTKTTLTTNTLARISTVVDKAALLEISPVLTAYHHLLSMLLALFSISIVMEVAMTGVIKLTSSLVLARRMLMKL